MTIHGNLLLTSTVPLGYLRRVFFRTIIFLTGVIAVCCGARSGLVFATHFKSSENPYISEVPTAARAIALQECEAELREARTQLEAIRNAAFSRMMPQEILRALQIALPGSVWIIGVRGEGRAISIDARAESELDIRTTLTALESSGIVTEVRLESTKSPDIVSPGRYIEFQILANLRRSGR